MLGNNYNSAPEWLTVEYLEPVLRKYTKDMGLQITDLTAKPASAKGENYISVMTRIHVKYLLTNCKEIQIGWYIVKAMIESDPVVASILNDYDVYRTEMIMYEKILPELTKVLQEIGDADKLFADTLHVDYEHSAIIFEDLAVTEFVVADRLAGMDETHTKLALKKLAKMHATASVLNERMPDVLTKFDHGIFNRHTRGFDIFFEEMIEVCANFAGNCAELGAYYKEKLLKLKPHVAEYATRVYDHHDGHYHTLTHGDFWINNIMLRYNQSDSDIRNAQSIRDIRIIDFQFCSWSSPAVDLHYFFNTSLESDLRLHRQDALLQYYHNTLVRTLRKLKFGGFIPTLHELVLQFESGRFYAVTASLVNQALMINDQTEDADFSTVLSSGERGQNFRNLLYANKTVQDNVKLLLPIYDRRGLLDVVD